jgi:hypothetical protein
MSLCEDQKQKDLDVAVDVTVTSLIDACDLKFFCLGDLAC